MQARGFLNYRLKYCWLKLICCICQHELEREMRPHKARANEVEERTPTTNNIVLFRLFRFLFIGNVTTIYGHCATQVTITKISSRMVSGELPKSIQQMAILTALYFPVNRSHTKFHL